MYFINKERTKIIDWNELTGTFEEFVPMDIGASESETTTATITRKKQTCSVCGKPGHRATTCSKNKPSLPELHTFRQEVANTDDQFEITDDVIDQVKDMLEMDQGTREIAEHFSISIKVANQCVARAKGINLPNK